MKAVLRLVFAYFWGTRFRRIFAALGLALCACAFVELVRPPYAESMLAVAWAGIVSLFVGTGLMPLMLGRMARSRAMPLTLLGSMYLGLMITRGLRVFEAGLAVALMLALMAVAVIAARPGTDPTVVIALELILAGAVPVLRSVAQGRWTEMDWMQCRTDRALHARPAS